MDKINSSYGKWQRPFRYSNGIPNRWVNKWYQSEILGRPLKRIAQTEFTQRQNKREKEEKIGRCMRQITRDCRNLLKKKLEEVEAFNASIPENKFVNYNCFYCNQDGHITKFCPTKIKHDAVGITQDKFPVEKNMILCFRCREHGHFANKCPSKKQSQPTGIWDDFWYVSTSTNKHLTPNLSFFTNLKEEFLVEKLEGQKKLLFTYGMGEVVIKDGGNGCLIPGVHYAPEVTLNILSIDILKQQGFDIISEGDRWTLEYMFKKQKGQNMDIDKMRQRHNDYLDDYFESLDKERTDRKEQEPRIVEDTNALERRRFDKLLKWFYNHYLEKELPGSIPPVIQGVTIHLFDLYKLMDSMGGYLSVHFGLEFGALAEILGLTRSDGEEIRKCYMTYLEAFRGASSAEGKGKEKLEQFGIKVEEEEDCKIQQTAHYGGKGSQTTCYKCQDTGHYAFEYPEKNKRKGQTNYSSYMEPSTSKFREGQDSHSTSSPRLIIFKPANIGSLGQRPTGVPLVRPPYSGPTTIINGSTPSSTSELLINSEQHGGDMTHHYQWRWLWAKEGTSVDVAASDGMVKGGRGLEKEQKFNNVELRNVLGDTIGNPDQMRLKVEDRIRKKGRDFHKPKTGSVVAFKVTFRDFSPVGSHIWFKLYGPPSDPDVDLIGTVIQSCRQIHQWNTILFMMPSSFHDVGDVEFQDNWGRVWVDIGTSDYFALDVLLNCLTVLSIWVQSMGDWEEGMKNPEDGYKSFKI
ncbi:ARID DNA-binding domain-containing protein [Tanacetum coccineum]